MNTVLSLGVVQCLFLAFLVLTKNKKGVQDYWLATFLFFNAVQLVFFYANFNVEHLQYQKLLLAGSGFPLLNGPLFYIYVSSLVHKKQIPFKYLFIHFIPYLVFCIVFYYYLLLRPELDGISVYDGFIHIKREMYYSWPVRNISILFAISGGSYPIWTLLLLRQHTRNLYNEFSYFDKINLNWVKYWIIFSIIGFVLCFLVILIAVDYNYIERHDYAFKFITILITVQVFIIGFYGLKQSTIFSNIDLPEAELTTNNSTSSLEEKYVSSRLNEATVEKYVTNLLRTMKEEKPYLKSNLTIAMLSESLNISSHHLSQILNDQLHKNFFDFVNEYRLEEVKSKIVDPQYTHITLLGLAYDCGFNSKSSFNSIFKKITGQTPSQYKKTNA